MPKFHILATRRTEDILTTDVRFTFNDGGTVEVSIPHFRPQSRDDVEAGIRNRFLSERDKRIAAARAQALIVEMPTGEIEV